MKRIGLVGSLPPPYGGVTVHVKRLKAYLFANKRHVVMISGPKEFYQLLNCDIIHIHLNRPIRRLAAVILSRLLLKKVICTLHRDVNRDMGFNKKMNLLSIFFSDKWVVLNNESYSHYYNKFSNKTILSSSFIPPVNEKNDLKKTTVKDLREATSRFRRIVCTCAHHYREHLSQDIYGIFDILKNSYLLPDHLIVISDPSGEYLEKAKVEGRAIPENVFFISYQHNFIPIISMSDVFLRNTNTDGDSLSIHEALYYNKHVLASDCVSRPRGVNLFNGSEWVDILKKNEFVSVKHYWNNNILNLYEF